jgi:hypothetical protein
MPLGAVMLASTPDKAKLAGLCRCSPSLVTMVAKGDRPASPRMREALEEYAGIPVIAWSLWERPSWRAPSASSAVDRHEARRILRTAARRIERIVRDARADMTTGTAREVSALLEQARAAAFDLAALVQALDGLALRAARVRRAPALPRRPLARAELREARKAEPPLESLPPPAPAPARPLPRPVVIAEPRPAPVSPAPVAVEPPRAEEDERQAEGEQDAPPPSATSTPPPITSPLAEGADELQPLEEDGDHLSPAAPSVSVVEVAPCRGLSSLALQVLEAARRWATLDPSAPIAASLLVLEAPDPDAGRAALLALLEAGELAAEEGPDPIGLAPLREDGLPIGMVRLAH